MTKAGDKGMTTLADGSRIAKSSQRIKAIGNIDELNSLIGMVLAGDLFEEMRIELIQIQNDLFNIGMELAGSSQKMINNSQVSRLEMQAEKYDANLLPLQGFILPGGTSQGALLHYARSVCRRVERAIFSLAEAETVSDEIGKYVNRLSDMLFIYARVINRTADKPDLLWKKPTESED